jgi:hypothetical protein
MKYDAFAFKITYINEVLCFIDEHLLMKGVGMSTEGGGL